MSNTILQESRLDTPLGPLLAVADERGLYLLEFVDCFGLERKVERLRQKRKSVILSGYPDPIRSIESELRNYFDGTLQEFRTPLYFMGTLFQKQVWQELQSIPHGETCSYSDIAVTLGKPTACRAVARAISTNHLFLVIPCHRVIHSDGTLSGYGGGISRKGWLIKHEKTKGSCE